MNRTVAKLLALASALACNADDAGSGNGPGATADIPTFSFDADAAVDADADVPPERDALTDLSADPDAAVPDSELDAPEPDVVDTDTAEPDAPEPDVPGPDAPEPDIGDVRDDGSDTDRDADVEPDATPDAEPDMRACEGLSCDPRIPGCEGSSYVDYGPGECVIADDGIAECRYEAFPTDCAATGEVCTPSGCGADGFVDICVGGRMNTAHVCAVHADGRLWCWGDSEFSQLGPGSTGDDVPEPVEVPVPPVVDVACGGAHVCALDRDGLVWCWGANGFGQIGGPPGVRSDPLPVPGIEALSPIAAIEAGNNGTLALTEDGAVFHWGALGIRNVLASPEPAPLADDIVAMSANRGVVYLMPRIGLPFYVGSPGWGVLDSDELAPLEGEELSMASGGWDHSCGITREGTGICWGRDEGKTGDDSPEDMSHGTAVAVLDLPPVQDIAVAASAACAVTEAHTVWCWGIDGLGLMGRGGTVGDDPQLAEEIDGFLRDFVQVRAGWNSMFARTGDGRIYSWGGNETQCLGPRESADRRTASQVVFAE